MNFVSTLFVQCTIITMFSPQTSLTVENALSFDLQEQIRSEKIRKEFIHAGKILQIDYCQ
jgi:hypothetical protein